MIKRILIGIDGSEPSARALQYAADLAAGLKAELTVAHVVPPMRYPLESYPASMIDTSVVDALEQQAKQGGEALVRSALDQARTAGANARSEVLFGPAALTLAQAAEAGSYDLVVVGSRGHGGLKRAFVGSTSDRLVHVCHRPVLVVH